MDNRTTGPRTTGHAGRGCSLHPSPAITISVCCRHPRIAAPAAGLRRMFDVLAAEHGRLLPPGATTPDFLQPQPGGARCELSIAILTDDALAALHERFLGDPAPTDVITFPGDAAAGSAGEICVSADAALRATRHHGGWRRELALYLIHGWLHLLGHDDLCPQLKRRMRAAERRAMALLDAAGALPAFRNAADRAGSPR